MSQNDLEKFLDEFPIPSRKVFIYKQEFIPDHYITIEKNFNPETVKEVTFKIIESESTCIIPGFDLDLFCKLLLKEELKLNQDHRWYTNVISYRTDGCDCGAWATTNSNTHAFWCRRYFGK